MKFILSTLIFPVMMGIPFFRELGSFIGEFKEIAPPNDSIRRVSHQYGNLACFYRILMIHNHEDYVIEGLYRIVDDKNRIGFADTNGCVVIQPQFSYVRPFSEGVAAFNEGGKLVKNKKDTRIRGGKWGFINKQGEIVLSPVYDDVEDCLQGSIKAYNCGSDVEIINLQNPLNNE